MREYRIGDAREPINENPAVVAADLSWERPNRCGNYVTYPTYSPDNGLWEFVDAIHDSLIEGGYALFDCDDWLLPRLIRYLQDNWGDVAKTYRGGGYRRTGTVVYEGSPGGGHYFTNGGYHVVFSHKGETDRKSSVSSKLVSSRADVSTEWGTPKPIYPYQEWIPSIMEPDELLYVPCAGKSPAALALEREYEDPNYICIDSETEAKEAFEQRKDRITRQTRL